MHLRYSYRVYPTVGQRSALARTFGCARVVYNDALALRKAAWKADRSKLPSGALAKTVITDAKKTDARSWLGSVSVDALQSSLRDLDTAYRNFYDSLSGKRRGRPVGLPRFKSRKDNRQSLRFSRNGFRIRGNGKLNLAKIGDVRVKWARALPADPSSVTVVLDPSGRYHASFVVDIEPEHLPALDAEVGIDLGLTTYAVMSDGTVIDNPRFLRKAERRLKAAQRVLSRKAKGSRNRAKARRKVAKAHARVADTRMDWMHKQTTRLIRETQAIYLEDLNVRGLARTRLAKSVYDAGWSTFRRLLTEKAARYGRHVGVIGRYEPTSQVCSTCGVPDGPKPLNVRTWKCGACGTSHDRDLNAARNILAAGRADRLNACGGPVRPGVAIPRQARPVETGTHRNASRTGRKPRAAGAAGIPTP
ncbi:RNA-guided endonuclease InsQ/TnpB family protein [Kitasatospora gansuensis]|uniref:RNA-guided endonuclease InsQ/TnpB family protein n=1 Tax=Kitasatospora gansuensis TaxID=258050 RepID=UPI00161EF88D|nr:RNA-guided endonuclease TnpB family protein [Kitasatospora gansuensis]